MWRVIFHANMEVCERSSCVHSYHIYKDIWDAIIGEELRCEREPNTTEVIGMQSLSPVICRINIMSLF